MGDLTFLKHLDKISFVNTLTIKDNEFITNILNEESV